ncbi:putative flp pilus assembly protein TadB, partial [Vibrio parahaemolyticus EKP-028]
GQLSRCTKHPVGCSLLGTKYCPCVRIRRNSA